MESEPLKRRYFRLHKDLNRESDERSPSERDRDRILYSTAFRRLSRVTQVVSPDERQVLHNRLTHSLEVAQIARGLAVRLVNRSDDQLLQSVGGIDPIVAEAAALAHDLGHPPFGHVAETELDRRLTEAGVTDGFEGNAQSFRIVTRLASRVPLVPGLNLCRATLAAILKYPWLRSDPRANRGGKEKWGTYDSESDELVWAAMLTDPDGQVRSIEAAIMDWADDIAYAVSDLEDFIRAGLIPLHALVGIDDERDRFVRSEFIIQQKYEGKDLDQRVEALIALLAFAPRHYHGSRDDRALLRRFTSALINRYISSVELMDNGPGESSLVINPHAKLEVDVLKGLTWHYVIRRSSLNALRVGQRKLIAELFAIFSEASMHQSEHAIFPRSAYDDIETAGSDHERLRIVADVIASMSETQAVEIHRRVTGRSLGSAMDDVLG